MESSAERKTISPFPVIESPRNHLNDERLKTDMSTLLTSLIHTRKACTSLFQRYTNSLESGVQYLCIGACTLFIGPHSFPSTKFYRVLHPMLETPPESATQLSRKSLHISDLSTNTLADLPESLVPGELIFEFQEDPSETWLFPEEAVVEATSINEPYEILADVSAISRETGTPLSVPATSVMTIHLSKVSKELWMSIKQVTKDVSFVYGYMTDKIKFLPNSLHMKYSLPCELPEALVKKTTSVNANHKETSNIKTPSKAIERRPSVSSSETRRNPKKSKTLGSSEVKKSKPAAVVSRKNSNTYNSNNGNAKKCAYCGCKSTPMWRRGPAGAGTLCNACGVKWKHWKDTAGCCD
ncbi:hypothetical protein K493DRAFT_334977 [Basidiobolus meristosporus CBS 931.73]|uniref:GATA-type domain-containing protein n=1 Tax=Basidiobolus meristosporus CBS 931.73 TaxID=1314790 RepID=A0A1Y1YTU6_9FUNG|nr:hypothetical protein K493DRAFT_334977 [Basidiobolus meristosporus CBS 931.73]|eukprot:ORY01396.1 hypothetical protein K493DRAFT_334977 [Basidiobolus meristosporus CBS 931.73]